MDAAPPVTVLGLRVTPEIVGADALPPVVPEKQPAVCGVAPPQLIRNKNMGMKRKKTEWGTLGGVLDWQPRVSIKGPSWAFSTLSRTGTVN